MVCQREILTYSLQLEQKITVQNDKQINGNLENLSSYSQAKMTMLEPLQCECITNISIAQLTNYML